jgi:hypothetical protein
VLLVALLAAKPAIAQILVAPLGGGQDDQQQLTLALQSCKLDHSVQLAQGIFTLKEPLAIPYGCELSGSKESQVHDGGTGTLTGTVLQQAGSGWSAGQAVVSVNADQVTVRDLIVAGEQSLTPATEPDPAGIGHVLRCLTRGR